MPPLSHRSEPRLLDPATYPWAVAIPTRFADQDRNGHVNNVSLIGIFEDARVRFNDAFGLPATRAGHGVRIVANHNDFVGETMYPLDVDVALGCAAIGRTSWQLACLAMQAGRPCAVELATFVCTRDGSPAPLPLAFRAALGPITLRL